MTQSLAQHQLTCYPPGPALQRLIQTPPGGLSTAPSTRGQSAGHTEPPTEARRPIRVSEHPTTEQASGGVSLVHTPRRMPPYIVLPSIPSPVYRPLPPYIVLPSIMPEPGLSTSVRYCVIPSINHSKHKHCGRHPNIPAGEQS